MSPAASAAAAPVPALLSPSVALRMVPRTVLVPSPLNPRKTFDDVKLRELASSLLSVGIIEPLVVRPLPSVLRQYLSLDKVPLDSIPREFFEIVCGERRFRAAEIAGLLELPAIVRELTDAQVLEIMVVENNQREGVNPLEEGVGFRRLLDTGYDVDHLAHRIGRSRRYIYDRMTLLGLIEPAKQLLLSDRLPAAHAIELARLKPHEQERAADPRGNALFTVDHGAVAHGRPRATLVEILGQPDDPYADLKPRSLLEFKDWVRMNVRFDRKRIDGELFPETAAALTEAADVQEKVVQVTLLHALPAGAKEGDKERVYCSSSWKRADGTKGEDVFGKRVLYRTCERSVLGVVVIGPERASTFKVCIDKACDVHWPPEPVTKSAGAASPEQQGPAAMSRDERQQRQQALIREDERREQQRQLWVGAKPAIRQACAAKLKPAKAPALGEIVRRIFQGDIFAQASALVLGAGKKPKTAEDFLRVCAMAQLVVESDNAWFAPRDFPRYAKRIGVDVAAVLKKAGAPEPVQTSAPAKKKGGRK